MVPVPDESESTAVIIFKMVMIVLTLCIVGFSTLGQGIDILKFRFRKRPRMGFTRKED